MNCEQAKKSMHAFVDKEINPQELKKLNEHIDSCASCTVEFEEIKYMVQLMGEIDLKELPLGFEEELHEKLLIVSKEIAHQKASHENVILSFAKKIIEPLKHFKMKRVYYAYAAIPLVMVIVVIASKSFLGLSKSEDAVSMEMNETVMETTNAMLYGAPADGSRAGSEQSVSINAAINTTSKGFDSSNDLTTIEPIAPSVSNTSDDYRDGRMIIQTANLSMDVEKFDDVITKLKDLVVSSGGYVENESTSYKFYISETDNLKYGFITIRIPANAYSNSLEQIKKLGLITLEASNANDVTKLYRDTASEIENLKVTELRLREIMTQAVEIDDILAIEKELTRIRGEISSYEKQIKNWESLVDLTTISINLNEVKSLKPVVERIDDSLFGKAKEGFINTINRIKRSIERFIIWVISSSPILLIIAFAAFVLSMIIRKRRKNNEN